VEAVSRKAYTNCDTQQCTAAVEHMALGHNANRRTFFSLREGTTLPAHAPTHVHKNHGQWLGKASAAMELPKHEPEEPGAKALGRNDPIPTTSATGTTSTVPTPSNW
jgi:hypothetical protein